LVSDVSVEPVAFVFMDSMPINLKTLKMKATRFFEMSRTIYAATQRQIPEERNPVKNVLTQPLFYARLFCASVL
jgi:hypothetical protein